MVTNLTNLTNVQNFFDLVEYTIEVTGGFMGMGFMITLFIILIMSFMRFYDGIDQSILAASFLCFGVSIILTSIGLLNFYFIIAFGGMMAIDGFWLVLKR